MVDETHILKNEDNQTPVPEIWRNTIFDIVEAFKEGDFKLERKISGVKSISVEDAARISDNIRSYGDSLVSLPKNTWDTSVCQWMRKYWDVLVDLYTEREGESDLALMMRVYEEEGSSYLFEVSSVHVP
jgi:hypothetical protein